MVNQGIVFEPSVRENFRNFLVDFAYSIDLDGDAWGNKFDQVESIRQLSEFLNSLVQVDFLQYGFPQEGIKTLQPYFQFVLLPLQADHTVAVGSQPIAKLQLTIQFFCRRTMAYEALAVIEINTAKGFLKCPGVALSAVVESGCDVRKLNWFLNNIAAMGLINFSKGIAKLLKSAFLAFDASSDPKMAQARTQALTILDAKVMNPGQFRLVEGLPLRVPDLLTMAAQTLGLPDQALVHHYANELKTSGSDASKPVVMKDLYPLLKREDLVQGVTFSGCAQGNEYVSLRFNIPLRDSNGSVLDTLSFAVFGEDGGALFLERGLNLITQDASPNECNTEDFVQLITPSETMSEAQAQANHGLILNALKAFAPMVQTTGYAPCQSIFRRAVTYLNS